MLLEEIINRIVVFFLLVFMGLIGIIFMIDDIIRIFDKQTTKTVVEIIFCSSLVVLSFITMILFIWKFCFKFIVLLICLIFCLYIGFYGVYGNTINTLSPIGTIIIIPTISLLTIENWGGKIFIFFWVLIIVICCFVKDLIITTPELIVDYYSTSTPYLYVLFGYSFVLTNLIIVTSVLGYITILTNKFYNSLDKFTEDIKVLNFDKLKKSNTKYQFRFQKFISDVYELIFSLLEFVPDGARSEIRKSYKNGYLAISSEEEIEETTNMSESSGSVIRSIKGLVNSNAMIVKCIFKVKEDWLIDEFELIMNEITSCLANRGSCSTPQNDGVLITYNTYGKRTGEYVNYKKHLSSCFKECNDLMHKVKDIRLILFLQDLTYGILQYKNRSSEYLRDLNTSLLSHMEDLAAKLDLNLLFTSNIKDVIPIDSIICIKLSDFICQTNGEKYEIFAELNCGKFDTKEKAKFASYTINEMLWRSYLEKEDFTEGLKFWKEVRVNIVQNFGELIYTYFENKILKRI